ncbi:MAG TPA: hypothetical protein PKE51_02740 [Gemmatimonadaceae bacterium]|nr:hypothetical protein [Gemmatimonadaceae bacterium]
MRVIACPAPLGAIEPAPLTSLPLPELQQEALDLAAFWAADDRYYVRADVAAGAARWFRIESGASEDLARDAARFGAAGRDDDAVIGHVGPRNGAATFPIGSSGRFVFRVWRGTRGAEQPGRTRILAVRAARSRRLPA